MDYKPALIGGLGWRGVLHYFHTEYELAERNLARTLELSSELRDSFMMFFSLLFLGLTRANLGRISEALAALDEINELARRNGELYQVLKVPNSMGWIHRELGDLEGAAEFNRCGVEIARKHQVLEAEVNSAINLSYDYISQGEAEKATRVFADAEMLLGRDEWTRWRFSLRLQAAKCEHLLSQGDLIKTEASARRLFETASRYEARKYVASARRILADVAVARGDLAGAAAELHAALELLREYPAPLTAWRMNETNGRLHSRSGAPSLAQGAFDRASAIIRMIAANVNDQKLRSIFLESTAVKDVLENSSAQRDPIR
jgi:tetratricopeptide (TPR) repeat protein